MALGRVTEGMVGRQALVSVQDGRVRLSQLQERLTTGRLLNRPSDSPTDTVSALRLRDAVAMNQQHQRNGQDARSWLGTIDSAIAAVTDQARQARDLGLQGASSGTVSPAARNALATTVDGLRDSLLSAANTQLLGRPVFGGTTAGATAYAPDGSYVGDAGQVVRTVGPDQRLRVDVSAQAVFGAEGDSVFDHLTDLAAALRSGDDVAVRRGVGLVNADLERLATTRAEVGTRQLRVDQAVELEADRELRLKASLSGVEDVDLPEAIVELKLQEAAYQAALGATGRVLQPSLMDFLR